MKRNSEKKSTKHKTKWGKGGELAYLHIIGILVIKTFKDVGLFKSNNVGYDLSAAFSPFILTSEGKEKMSASSYIKIPDFLTSFIFIF